MRTKLVPFFVLAALLAACGRFNVSAPLVCGQPGRVDRGSVEETQRGFPYHFRVFLPPCYDLEPSRAYPVLYLFPGRTGDSGDWFAVGIADTANRLILAGDLPPLLIFSLENTEGDFMADDFYKDMLPNAEANYRILPGARYHAVAGGSLGGVPSYRLGFRFPEQFGSVGMFGSGAIAGEEDQIRAWLEAIPAARRPRLFLNTGYQDPLMLERAHAMIALVDEFEIKHTEIFTEGGHNYAYWASNFGAFLEWLAEGW